MSALIAANCSGIKASRQPTPLLEWMKGPGTARLARYGHVEEMIVNVKMSVMVMFQQLREKLVALAWQARPQNPSKHPEK
jgi:hypothetical protein